MNLVPQSAEHRIYVHLMSGRIEELCPADGFLVAADIVEILNNGQEVARFTTRDILFCSHLDVSPFPCS